MGKSSGLMTLAVVVVIVAGGLFALSQAGSLGLVKGLGTQAAVVQQVTTPSGQVVASGIQRNCQGITTITLNSAARNPLNPSAEYHAAAFRVVADEGKVGIVAKSDLPGGTIVATGTGTAGVALTYTGLSIPCDANNFDGELYATSTALINSAKGTYSIAGTAGAVVIDQANSTVLNVTPLSNSLTNTSAGANRLGTESAVSAMSAGDTRSGYLDFQAAGNTSYGQFGAAGLGIIWAYDSVTSAAFSDNSLSLTTSDVVLSPIDCLAYPKTAAVLSANRCWKTDPISTSTGLIRVRYVLTNDGGTNAGASDDPVLYLADVQYIEDQDSKIRMGTHNSAGSDVGTPNTQMTFDNS